jgi:hypothetical protein
MKKSTTNGIVWIVIGIAIFIVCSIIQSFGESTMFSDNYYSTGNEILDLLIEIVFIPGWIGTIGCIGKGVIQLFLGLSSSDSPQIPPYTNPANPPYPSSQMPLGQQPYPTQATPSIAQDQFDPSQEMDQSALPTAVQPQPQPYAAQPLQPQPYAVQQTQPQPYAVQPQQTQPYAPQQPQPYAVQPQQTQPYAPQQPQSYAPQQAQPGMPVTPQPQPYTPQQAQPGMPPAAFQQQRQPYALYPQQTQLSLTPHAKRCAGALISAAAISVLLGFVQNSLLYSTGGFFYYPILILKFLAPAVLLFTAISIALTAQKLPKTGLLSNGRLLYAIALGAAGIYYLIRAYGSLASFRFNWLGTVSGGSLGFVFGIVLLLLVVAALYQASTQMQAQGIGNHSLFRLSVSVAALELIWLLFTNFAGGPLFNAIYSAGLYSIAPFISFLLNLVSSATFLVFFILQAMILNPRPLGR